MTEDVNPKFKGFDQWPVKDMVAAMHEGQIAAISALAPALNDITYASEMAAERLGAQGRLIYVGAGTSGRIAVQDGAELGPTFSWPQERTIFCMAGGMGALTVSAEGAEDILEDGVAAMRHEGITKYDVVFGVAASGKTPFTLGALQEANGRGALTIGIANNPDTPILAEAAHPILVETGSEIIAGSTRMKAGTAQKVVLNMISTAIMTMRGHVYNGLMVDMIASNTKLENRAIKMVCDITGCSADISAAALNTAEQHIKTACLIALGQSHESSRKVLQGVNGNLRGALKAINHV